MKMANHRPESGAPRATYRLQLTAEHGLDHAASIVDYLAALGVSHLYTSPFFRAAPGSMHGYDGVDPEHISKDLGDEKSFHQLAAALKRHGLGLVVDLVPNHLSLACRENWRWWDVLRFGRQSRYADWFDVDWDSPEARPAETVLLPILGDHVGICIEKAEIRLTLALHDEAHDSPAAPEERVELAYYEQQFPVAPGSVPGLAAGMGNQELQATLERINNDPEALEAVVAAQHYRLAYWKTGPDELNYRRFFAVNELVGVRVELPHVFQETHRRVLELVQQEIGRAHV